jgi:hypothetical protein
VPKELTMPPFWAMPLPLNKLGEPQSWAENSVSGVCVCGGGMWVTVHRGSAVQWLYTGATILRLKSCTCY